MKNLFNYLKKLKISKHNGFLLNTIVNSINYKRHLYYVKRTDIKELLMEDIAYKKLKKKYGWVLSKEKDIKESKYSDKVWVCWLQGVDKAPLLSQRCINRIVEIFGKNRTIIITDDNYGNYIKLPEHIKDKWEKGMISHAHFSDILRVWLLVEHGGTWIDSTVLLIGDTLPDYFTQSNLFVFSNMKRNSVINISSWYISAFSHNRILESVKELLTEYWKHENGTIHYFVFHLFFSMATEKYNDLWEDVPKFSNIQPHILASELFRDYDENRLNQIKEMCCVQKLSNKIKIENNNEGTFYDILIKKGKSYGENIL